MRITDTSDLWWKTAVVYCLDIETYFDSDGDGIGDIAGLAQRVDYLADLGVTCIWLMPFYPTPDRDDGYDVTDFYGVDQRLGDHGDLVEFLRTARDRGMRVIADLIVNHTSDQHPWFQSAKQSKDSPYRDYYVWRSDPPPPTSKQVVFPDQEDSIWTKEETTGEWYLHRFYKHQPDLNVTNPAVRDHIAKAMGFWLELGVNGFRVDAVPFFLETTGEEPEELPDPHEFLRDLRRFLNRRSGEGILLGEVNLPYKEQTDFFGGNEGDELNVMFDFMAMQNMYLALARQDARPLAETLAKRPAINPDNQWATFVRNHDELTLDKLSEEERQEVFAAFGPEERMQLYGRGLKRRLPPMLGGDPRHVKMVYSLLFSLPGTPVLYYGEEIGMGEDLEAEGRMAVRTPMQWTDDANAGFSTAPPGKLVSPLVDGGCGPQFVNAAQAKRDPDSLWSFMATLIRRYRECPELGWGRFELLRQPASSVLAHRCTWETASLVLVHNLSPEPATVTIDLATEDEPEDKFVGSVLLDLLGDENVELADGGRCELPLGGYGYRWLRVLHAEDRRLP
ncbi:alpha-amylase family protein [Arthrobacter crystallopoietes]|uniref:alpha-amylase family protein n=1 Tax=Crystallibacter crystallopoietes TaxID=37928 RepID=UPI001ABE6E4D|nr:alpha-amylase family protein [Arthrobacter crystallopoietes]QTG81347.1 alpha-glucosidase C-terminal domain-containing protein [Arthrobacter crystallopoietes]